MKKRGSFVITVFPSAILLSAISRPAPAVEEPVPSDVLIRIARVYDASLNGPFEADLAVKDGLIVISSK
jgi:hypothetical protein